MDAHRDDYSTRQVEIPTSFEPGVCGFGGKDYVGEERQKFMKQEISSQVGGGSKTAPVYLKILGSGEIVKQRGFSEVTQLYEVESVDGKVYTIQSNRVSQLVETEEAKGFESR